MVGRLLGGQLAEEFSCWEDLERRCSGAEEHEEELRHSFGDDEEHASAPKATARSIGIMPGINPRPTARMGFSPCCVAGRFQEMGGNVVCEQAPETG